MAYQDFDDFQRAEYFAMVEVERALVFRRKDLGGQIYCLLKIGYFKAKQTFFGSIAILPDAGFSRAYK